VLFDFGEVVEVIFHGGFSEWNAEWNANARAR
jgi:hypothetical protein